ncbi:ATP-dependent zinc protease family protein [Maridesulfovibrio frigidus]|uniref:ATP-dependent zinc protease family protein n=1 Tax=Maridesulfovibrio frigidus TaxID=340956 RepID=UPI00068F1C2F|nr:ATP-dependent zinc protease [Maridesulfovibrio frigidus]
MKLWVSVLLLVLAFTLGACGPKQTQSSDPTVSVKMEDSAAKPAAKESKPEVNEAAPVLKLKPESKSEAEVEPAPEVKKPKSFNDMLIIGQKEYVFIDEAKMKLAARIDTGATTSSVSATKIQRYERDGKKWVRFTMTSPAGQSVQIERPLKRVASIKRHGMPDQERPVVELHVILGSINTKSEFTLTDRSKFEFPVLIGRTFLGGRAVVDVTLDYETSPMSDENEK